MTGLQNQINLVAYEETLKAIKERLRTLYRTAMQHTYALPDGTHTPKFINLDMEEYQDLHLTVAAFKQVLDEPEFKDYRAGIVLQAYLPDSASVQRRVRLYPYALAASREARRQQQQAARAEYLLLEGIQHPGVERALDLVEHERGPALLFEYHPEALRLDVWLERHLARLDRGERLALLRQLAETLRFLHARRIYHRALSPASVWVLPPEEGAARLRIGDWQHALGDARETTSSHGDEPFHGIEQDPARLLYLAPEALASPAADPVRLDTFALGAIAYRLFTGQPPAPSPQALERKLADGQGLAVSEVLALPRIRLYRLKGVGQRTVRAIRELSEQLAAQLAVGESAPALEADAGDGDEAGQWPVLSVDQLLKRLTGLQLATSERAVLEAFLGLNETCPPWCGQQEVAETLGVSRADVQQVLERARSRWQRQGWMSALRRQLSQVLQRHGGLMLLDEVADTLVALRGSLAEGAERRRRARALATAAIETEAATAQTAWVLYRGPHRSLLVATGALLAGQAGPPPPGAGEFRRAAGGAGR